MKKLMTIFCFLLSVCLLEAQQYDVLQTVQKDIRKAYGMEGPHRLDEFGPQSPAPVGYKPFYLSHYGRHGSRYAWNAKTYTMIHDVLSKAAEKDLLTPYGKEFAAKYEEFWQEPYINAGDLVPLGFQQHKAIGKFLAVSYPELFTRGRSVYAISSTAQRCIVSMGGFCTGLLGETEGIDLTMRSDHVGMATVVPPSAPKQLRRSFKGQDDKPAGESSDDFSARMIPKDEILARLFTNTDFLSGFKGGADSFVSELWQLVSGYHNYEPRPLFDDLLTQEQVLKCWEADNYYSYTSDLTARYGMIPLLEDIICKANAAIEDQSIAANLRFGHDYILEGFSTLININGLGTTVSKAEDAKYWFQNYSIPMAATMAIIFYRAKNGRPILFKVLLNENEATLPQLTPVEGPYYNWEEFCEWADKQMKEHPEVK